jgi:hypothetical protein
MDFDPRDPDQALAPWVWTLIICIAILIALKLALG